MSPIYEHRFCVPQSAIDANGHVGNVEYLHWLLDAATAHATATGGTQATRNANATWVVRSHHIEYLRPAFANEDLTILTWIASVSRARSLRKYQIRRNDTLLVKAETDWVLIDTQSGRPRTIPQEISSCFQILSPDSEL